MKKKILFASLLLLIIVGFFAYTHLDRGRMTTDPAYTDLRVSISENKLISDRNPAVVMQFGSAFRYIGGQKFVLYGEVDKPSIGKFFRITVPLA